MANMTKREIIFLIYSHYRHQSGYPLTCFKPYSVMIQLTKSVLLEILNYLRNYDLDNAKRLLGL